MIRSLRAALLAVAALAPLAPAAGPEFVEPSELTRHPELVGRDVVVDDRIRYFLESRRGAGYDELLLRRTEVPFKLPARLRFARSPSEPNARVLGTLKVEEGRLICEVTAIELLPADLDRLDRELARVRPEDFQARRTWALWAQRRGKELNDPRLETRGADLEAEALRVEADRPGSDALALFARSASRPIPEASRIALAHRGFRDRFARAASPAEYDALADQVENTLPAAADPKTPDAVDRDLAEAYARDPAAAYRDATAPARAALDRRLRSDIVERSLIRRLEARPAEAAALAEAARARLPERPEIADRLRQRGLDEAETRVASMRQSEAEGLARTFREQGQDDRGRRILLAWLADRRKNRLSGSDAEGRILLAGNYEKLLGDRATAADLLREALVIDPQSKTAIDAFLRLGYRKGDAGWYDPAAARAPAEPTGPAADPGRPAAPAESADSLKGLTRAQVRSRLGGKPDQVVRSASQGRCVEQWIYRNGKVTQVVVFPFDPATTEPRASAYFTDRK